MHRNYQGAICATKLSAETQQPEKNRINSNKSKHSKVRNGKNV